MIARKYQTKIQIKERQEVSDGFGGWVISEVTVKSIWANTITKGAGTRFIQYGLNDFKAPVIFSVRGKNGLTFNEHHFIVYKGKKYEIKGIENVNLEGLEYNILCDEA